ncbi:Hypothetical protein NTJ_13811 [Nesidiocoris tenuis]|uniref:G-protein coupled receptors family 2 profile 2 domain-containing protein n=1 Tax=Nesidiocoris tenuis TaxID=355587 RepID=A0ABN7BBH5_9HEMI|nr:Hypothetical protein NTJ_13811 [Nesidiocoris tenuis]
MNCRCKKGWDFDDSYALWHTCKKGYPRCFSAGSTRSQPPLIGLITLGKDRRKIITALRLTTTRYDLLESTEGSNKFAIRRKAKRIDAENEYPMNMTCECQKSLGASLFYYDVWYHCKEGHLRCIPMNLNQSRSPITVEPVGDGPMSDWPMTEGPITTLNPETKYQRDKETQTVSTRFYWLQRFTAMLPNFLALPALIMGIWLVIIRCRKLQQHKSWLKAQFVCIVANFTGLLWICVFIICDYHTNRILMILNCLMLLSLIIMCLSSIVSFIIVLKNYKKTQEVPTEQQRE